MNLNTILRAGRAVAVMAMIVVDYKFAICFLLYDLFDEALRVP